jgi:hypothetical protein
MYIKNINSVQYLHGYKAEAGKVKFTSIQNQPLSDSEKNTACENRLNLRFPPYNVTALTLYTYELH